MSIDLAYTPEEMENLLRGREWAELRQGQETLAFICPLCSALVPNHKLPRSTGSTDWTRYPVEHHTQYHVAVFREAQRR